MAGANGEAGRLPTPVGEAARSMAIATPAGFGCRGVEDRRAAVHDQALAVLEDHMLEPRIARTRTESPMSRVEDWRANIRLRWVTVNADLNLTHFPTWSAE